MIVLDVNTGGLYRYSNTLKQLHKSALPSAIRDALSAAAKDVKTVTMPKTSGEFVNRTKTFFKANSKFVPAKGFEINAMQSEVGFYDNKLTNRATNYAIKDLEQQEEGGVIGGRSFKPTIFARVGNTRSGMIRANARLSALKGKIIDASIGKVYGTSQKQRFMVAAKQAGKGGFVLSGTVLWRIDENMDAFAAKRAMPGKHVKGSIKRTPLYGFKKHGKSKVNSTHFMQRASVISSKKIDDFYIEQAQRQIKKFVK